MPAFKVFGNLFFIYFGFFCFDLCFYLFFCFSAFFLII